MEARETSGSRQVGGAEEITTRIGAVAFPLGVIRSAKPSASPR
jgi:hypothetical protein